MSHLLLTSTLLFALLALVAIAIGAFLGIARDLVLDDGADENLGDDPRATTPSGRTSPAKLVGLRHAATFASARGGSFRGNRSLDT
jgi:hypothetical protein